MKIFTQDSNAVAESVMTSHERPAEDMQSRYRYWYTPSSVNRLAQLHAFRSQRWLSYHYS